MSRWLLLAHQLPVRPSNARVKTWRRLQQIGAIAVRNSAYALPNTEQCREDMEWLRGEIVALGGTATVFTADAVDGDSNDAIVRDFQSAREADYRTLKREADGLARTARRIRAGRPPAAVLRSARALRERLTAIQRIDFFTAPAREPAEQALDALERLLVKPSASRGRAELSADAYRDRRWVTRPRPGVDRMASAWLIRRFVDPHAVFAFSNRPLDGAVSFDMYGGDFTHDGALCTYETMVRRFGVADPAVERIGRIVHDLDIKDDRYNLPENAAVGRLIEGLRAMHADDGQLLEQGIAMFEALARSFAAEAQTR